MYLLLSRIPSGLDPLRERFEVHVKKAGTSSVEKTAGDGTDVVRPLFFTTWYERLTNNCIRAQDPKAYVDSLLSVHRKNVELVSKAFRGDPGFVASLDKVRLFSLVVLAIRCVVLAIRLSCLRRVDTPR